jgi:NAD(P)H-hydrate repair Nnr-like enzyme with NAD(P)H-hydrate dehydratase domain
VANTNELITQHNPDTNTTAATAMHSEIDHASIRNANIQACLLSTVLSKRAAEYAFAMKGRSMTAPDVVEHIGEAFRVLYPEG